VLQWLCLAVPFPVSKNEGSVRMSVVARLRPVQRGGTDHPRWCAPDRCRAGDKGRVHESAPLTVGELTLTVHQPVASAEAYAVLTIDTRPDGSGQTVALRLNRALDLSRALLELYCQS
jgi:hypothetical protein